MLETWLRLASREPCHSNCSSARCTRCTLALWTGCWSAPDPRSPRIFQPFYNRDTFFETSGLQEKILLLPRFTESCEIHLKFAPRSSFRLRSPLCHNKRPCSSWTLARSRSSSCRASSCTRSINILSLCYVDVNHDVIETLLRTFWQFHQTGHSQRHDQDLHGTWTRNFREFWEKENKLSLAPRKSASVITTRHSNKQEICSHFSQKLLKHHTMARMYSHVYIKIFIDTEWKTPKCYF